MTSSCRRLIKCVCPSCGTEHKLLLFWTGRLPPRKLCEKCKERSSGIEEEYSFSTSNSKNCVDIYPLPNPAVEDLDCEI